MQESPDAGALSVGPLSKTAFVCGDVETYRVEGIQENHWDGPVKDHPACSFFHSTAWAKVLSETYGYSPLCFGLRHHGQVSAFLPMMEVNSHLTGRRGISLPFTDYCEPLVRDPSSLPSILHTVIQHGKSRGWRYVELRGGRNLLRGVSSSASFYSHRLRLSAKLEDLFECFDSAVRRAIRKAERVGLQVGIHNTLSDVKDFFALHCGTRRRHGLPPQPFSFFQSIYKHILCAGLGFIVLAKYKNAPVAAAMFFHSGEGAVYKFGASSQEFNHLRANNLTIWEAIKWYASHNYTTLHFGRTSIENTGLRRFKQGWGTEESQLHYFKYDLQRNYFLRERGELLGWHHRIVQTVPIFISRLLGRLIYRHVA